MINATLGKKFAFFVNPSDWRDFFFGLSYPSEILLPLLLSDQTNQGMMPCLQPF
jgi:hypothetical protein